MNNNCFKEVKRLTEFVLLSHGVNKVTWAEALVESLGEFVSGAVKGTTESGSDGQETGHKGTDKILSCSGCDDGVHGTRHGGTVIGGEHENHL